MTTSLSHVYEIHAIVTYNHGFGFDDHTFKGWVWIDPLNRETVCARKFGGRRNFQLCKADHITNVAPQVSSATTPTVRPVK